jgi:hypothetical protein
MSSATPIPTVDSHPEPRAPETFSVPIDQRPARLLDVEVARDVLGFETRELVGAPEEGQGPQHVAWLMKSTDSPLWEPLPRFSTDERAAHMILAFVKGHGVDVEVLHTRGWCCVQIEGSEYPKARQQEMAICRAALAFVRGE